MYRRGAPKNFRVFQSFKRFTKLSPPFRPTKGPKTSQTTIYHMVLIGFVKYYMLGDKIIYSLETSERERSERKENFFIISKYFPKLYWVLQMKLSSFTPQEQTVPLVLTFFNWEAPVRKKRPPPFCIFPERPPPLAPFLTGGTFPPHGGDVLGPVP